MNSLLLCGGRVIDPANGLDDNLDVLVEGGKITEVDRGLQDRVPSDYPRMELAGRVVCPGLIDCHVHLREPGQGAKETIASGTRAAARGGFTTVVCMPNTDPPIDNSGAVALIHEKAERSALVNVLVAGAISKGLAGEELASVGSLKQAGVVALTDDGRCVQNHELMRRAMEYAHVFELPLLDHCQDYSLVTEGVMHEGYWSTVLGLRGWPAAGEEAMVIRNILLAELTGSRVHCQHISTRGSVRLLREARSRGVPISGEACPHHFVLTDAAIAGSEEFWRNDGSFWTEFQCQSGERLPWWPAYDTAFKMNPPLRAAADRDAVIEAVVDGTLEILASDHAPHCSYEKDVEFDYAPFGITGLETALPLALMRFVHSGRMTLTELLSRWTVGPASLLGLKSGTLSPGRVADITVFDPDAIWTFTKETTCSRSLNSPFNGWRLRGQATATIVGGKVVWQPT